MQQCEAILFSQRSTRAGEGTIAVPRRCREPAHEGEYCPIHERHREVQGLYRALLGGDWEYRIERWKREREARLRREERERGITAAAEPAGRVGRVGRGT